MKYLISAFACSFNKGSEWELGWSAVDRCCRTAREVVLVTHPDNQSNIETHFPHHKWANVTILYYKLPWWHLLWEHTKPGFLVNVYLWELFVFFFLRNRYQKNEFDVAMRASYATFRVPSFLWYFGREFVLDPISGGDTIPFRLMSLLSWRGWITEGSRMFFQWLVLVDPLVCLTLRKATRIVAISESTRSFLPAFAQAKCAINPQFIKVDRADFMIDEYASFQPEVGSQLRLLFIGRLYEWKGLKYALMALRHLQGRVNYEFTIIGDGPAKAQYHKYSTKYGLHVAFLTEQIARKHLSKQYFTHHLLLYPSFHRSAGFVLLEAQMHQLPVMVLDLSYEPGLLNPQLTIEVNTKRKSNRQIALQMAEKLIRFDQARKKELLDETL